MGAGDILLLLCLGLYLAVVGFRTAALFEADATLKNLREIVVVHVHRAMGCLVVEQANASERHGNGVFVAGHDDMVVANRTASLGDILYAALVGALDIVAEGEEGVGT